MRFPSLFGPRKLRKKKNRSKPRSQLTFESLESRRLLAGIYFDAASGFVTVSGDGAANIGQFEAVNATTLRASVDGANQDFVATDVTKIIFIGFGGNDQFTNSTSVDGLLLGNDGNDVLVGGSGFDQINGGAGDDQITGNAGNDRLIAGLGNDTVSGGAGDDAIFGTADTNTLNGDSGNDIIFGGEGVDTIDGGAGIDSIFAGGGNDILFSGTGGVAGSSGVSQADLILGLAGDDTFTGDTGLNVFYGGDGNDTMYGGAGENRMHGQNGADNLTGGSSADYLAGQNGDDVINGMAGDDYILPGFGDDTIIGGTANDIIVFSGAATDYQIFGTSDPFTVVDTRGVDGSDTISTVETFRFSDGDQPAGPRITHVVTVQPIIVSNNGGSNTAEYFGNSSQESIIKGLIDQIYIQAGVDIVWLPETTWSNTFANVGNRATRPTGDLSQVVSQGDSAGVGNSNPLIIDMYFVEVAAGFDDTGENTTNGLAFVDSNGITMHVGDNLPSFGGGRTIIAQTAAHEIAHNLGLDHVNDPVNLMDDGDELTPSQIATILSSQFAIPV